MEESKFGQEDSRGHWAPDRRISYGPAFAWPPRPKAFLKWFFGFPGYLLPWNIPYALLAVGIWLYLTPPLETFQTLLVHSRQHLKPHKKRLKPYIRKLLHDDVRLRLFTSRQLRGIERTKRMLAGGLAWCKMCSGPCAGLALVQAAFRAPRWLFDGVNCFPVPAVVGKMG